MGEQITLVAPVDLGLRPRDDLEPAMLPQQRLILIITEFRGDPRPEMSGHFHPKLRLQLKGRRVSRRCFVASRTKLILPAFGSLTGGLDASHPEILKQVGVSASALVPLSDRILRFPIAA